MNQTEFGNRLGVQQRTVSRWESGQVEPKRSMLEKIAVAASVRHEWLSLGTGDMTETPALDREELDLLAAFRKIPPGRSRYLARARVHLGGAEAEEWSRLEDNLRRFKDHHGKKSEQAKTLVWHGGKIFRAAYMDELLGRQKDLADLYLTQEQRSGLEEQSEGFDDTALEFAEEYINDALAQHALRTQQIVSLSPAVLDEIEKSEGGPAELFQMLRRLLGSSEGR